MKKILTLMLCISSVSTLLAKSPQMYEEGNTDIIKYSAPEWYEDAKIGFWPIWGVYSVPAFKGDHAAEWYGRWMYSRYGQSERDGQGVATFNHHSRTYGSPLEFGYKDFIPMFTADKFDADEWADLCVRGGGKFLTALAVFHDCFVMWDTESTKWNSVDMGPKRDIVAEVKAAADKRGLKFGVSNHSAWNYSFFQWNHINRYDATDKANEDLYGNPIIPANADTIHIVPGMSYMAQVARLKNVAKPSKRDLDRWLDRTIELADKYSPDLYYFDWCMNTDEFTSRRDIFMTHYYNNGITNGQGEYGAPGVVLNYKGPLTYPDGSGVRDIERGGMDEMSDKVWQTDDCIYGGHNWGYAEGEPIKETNVIIDELMDVISKRGILMLAFAPKADGSVPEDQERVICEIGDWLKVCGEAVYSTRPYKIMGELSKEWNEVDNNGHKRYIGSASDIRYTRSKDNKTLYATLLDWPESETLTIKTLADIEAKKIKSISMVGTKGKLHWKQTAEGLVINMPSKPDYGFAYPIKISLR